MSVVLIGYRGSGKTTVGRLLAQRLGWPLADTDQMITDEQSITIREIFDSGGEAHFRSLESAALAKALSQESIVLATGGGIILRESNRDMLRQSGHPVVYLSAPPEQLLAQIAGDTNSHATRPNLTSLGGGIDEIRHLLESRDPLYRDVATFVVDASRPAEVIASEIQAQLARAKESN